MDLKTPTTTVTATITIPPTATTTPETDTETPPTKHLSKCLSFTNGTLKLHHPHSPPSSQQVVVYKECLKNHAASLGGHALDGCGEFMPSPTSTPTDPTSLKCAACGCHRNFHRRDPEEQGSHLIEYHPPQAHPHPHLPAPQPNQVRSPNSISPPPISSSYYPSAPQMLLALSTGVKPENHQTIGIGSGLSPMGMSSGSRKRFRTKFSQEQKDKMYSFSERLGWKMQKRDEGLVEEFCNEVGVGRGVLKVWMHNNKHTFGKREVNGGVGVGVGVAASQSASHHLLHNNTTIITPPNTTTTTSTLNHHKNGGNSVHGGTNCSSSSS